MEFLQFRARVKYCTNNNGSFYLTECLIYILPKSNTINILINFSIKCSSFLTVSQSLKVPWVCTAQSLRNLVFATFFHVDKINGQTKNSICCKIFKVCLTILRHYNCSISSRWHQNRCSQKFHNMHSINQLCWSLFW